MEVQSPYAEKRRKRNRLLRLVAGIFVGAGVAAFIYGLLFTDIFRYERVVLEGARALTLEALFPEDARPLLWSRALPAHPLVASLIAHRNIFDRTLTLEVEERVAVGVWCGATGDCFWFDENGLLFARGPATKGALLVGVHEVSSRPLAPGDYLLPEVERKWIFDIFDILNGTGVKALSFSVEAAEVWELTAFTVEGTELYFSLRSDPSFTAEALVALREKLGTLQYVDFRSENRVFYK